MTPILLALFIPVVIAIVLFGLKWSKDKWIFRGILTREKKEDTWLGDLEGKKADSWDKEVTSKIMKNEDALLNYKSPTTRKDVSKTQGKSKRFFGEK